MKLEINKSSIIILAVLLAILIAGTYVAFWVVHKRVEYPPNYFVCNGQTVPFRANITNCSLFNVDPDNETLAGVLANPTAKQIAILVDPNGTAEVGLAAFDIYKIYKSLEPQTNIVAGIAYTYHWPEQPLIPNISSIDSATFISPVIWLRLNQSENSITVDGPKIYVNANTTDDLDAAACLISINLIKKVMGC